MSSKGQSVIIKYWAWNATVGAYQSGDSSNHNLNLYKDATEATPTNAVVEPDGTNTPGLYYVALTSAETNFNTVTIAGKSSTAGVSIFGQTISFENLPIPAVTLAGGLLTVGSGAGQISSNTGGVVDANVKQWLASTPAALKGNLVQTTTSSVGVANVTTWSGSPVAALTAGALVQVAILSGGISGNVNVTTWSGQPVAALVNGLVQTALSGAVSTNITQWSGQPVAALAAGGLIQASISGNPNVNVQTWAGQTAQTNAGLPIVTTALSGSPAGTVQANIVSVSGQPVAITSAGFLKTSVEQWQGLTVSTHISGIPDVNTLYWKGNPVQADTNNLPNVNIQDINGSNISAQLAQNIVTQIAVASGASVATPNLSTYLTDLQNLLGVGGTTTQNLYTTAQLTNYINKARMQIAGEGQCVRVLTPISNGIASIAVTSGGSGYTSAPTVVIVAPDSPSGQLPQFAGTQATAVASISGGVVTAITVQSAGAGYFNPGVTLIGGGGINAAAVASVSPTARTINFQEVYPFSQFNPLVQATAGVDKIVQVNSVNTIWGTFRYTLIHKSFSAYQSYARTYTAGYYYIPTVWAQYGQGTNGSIYMYPIPNDSYQLEIDCFCLPITLNTSTDVEAIPAQWTDAVPFLAAYYAFLGSQRMADAQMMWQEFEKYMKRARQQAQSHGTINPYGRA